MAARNGMGICKLTGKYGRYVDAHILPKALTRPRIRGNFFIQTQVGSRPVRRWSSWYDPHLVTALGEKILSDLDDWAIKELRAHQLVWSGHRTPAKQWSDHFSPDDSGYGLRAVQGIDRHRLRLFFLSLLWRAAASSLHEFAEITMSDDELEQLREMLVKSNPEPLLFYPCILTQISTVGVTHNNGPYPEETIIPPTNGHPERRIPIFRFYFQGLIAHIHRKELERGYTAALGRAVVGAYDAFIMVTIASEHTRQIRILKEMSSSHAAKK